MTDWHPTTVADIFPATEDLTELILDIGGTPLVGTHRTPGQYVRLALPEQPELGESPFAIASAPQPFGTRWEFLLKGGSPLVDTLMRLQPGARVSSQRPEGRGFPLSRARGKNLLLFATGSGISPIRSVIESVRAERSAYRRVKLYFGVRTPQSFAYEDELRHWEAWGSRVVRTVSQPGASGWQGLTGYVQGHLGEEKVDDTVAFVCGQSGMVQEVIDALRVRGLPREAIHLNY
jgi:NAD(P)H-flavin reductase